MSMPSDLDVLKSLSGSIVLAGAGKMGGAMLSGWIGQGVDLSKVVVLDPAPSQEISSLEAKGVRLNPKAVTDAAVLVVAVKPQMFIEVAPRLKTLTSSSTLVLSIMAGIPITKISETCGGKIIRAMPNTPAAIGRGVTVAVAAEDVPQTQRDIADALLRATGRVEWIDDESLMDAVTAVSGSGPAYVFLLAEELARAGVKAGLAPDLAARLARETIAGAGELLHRSELASDVLRQNVTSPGGTTAAALAVLMGDDGFKSLLERAVTAAAKRSRELAN
ncbi:MAG: pyrroline-5-carboxylate reductase [Bradyrhizobiaceae bacterium]|nr:MAG: pyrroline-5-carboxylate reductase [Bradyrhizobiaceae bacterium]